MSTAFSVKEAAGTTEAVNRLHEQRTDIGAPGVAEPTVRHHVEPLRMVRFHVGLWRAAERAVEP